MALPFYPRKLLGKRFHFHFWVFIQEQQTRADPDCVETQREGEAAKRGARPTLRISETKGNWTLSVVGPRSYLGLGPRSYLGWLVTGGKTVVITAPHPVSLFLCQSKALLAPRAAHLNRCRQIRTRTTTTSMLVSSPATRADESVT